MRSVELRFMESATAQPGSTEMAAQNGISSTSPQDGAPPRASIGVCADSRAAEKSEGSRSKAANPPPAFEFLDLRAQFAGIREEVMYAVSRVMESQRFILGEEVRLFEEELA